MKRLLFIALIFSFVLIVFVNAVEAYAYRTNGYYRRNGTYVQQHYRTSPDNSRWNNYSTRGNYNPYTGRKGYTSPYRLYRGW